MSTPVSLALLLSLLAIAGTATAIAADAPAAAQQPAPSKEMRAKMATLHERMAACLRSDKPLSECRADMMKDCHGMMTTRDCSMMGMSQGAMRMDGGMMQGPSESSGEKK
jgi:hypothetical protein